VGYGLVWVNQGAPAPGPVPIPNHQADLALGYAENDIPHPIPVHSRDAPCVRPVGSRASCGMCRPTRGFRPPCACSRRFYAGHALTIPIPVHSRDAPCVRPAGLRASCAPGRPAPLCASSRLACVLRDVSLTQRAGMPIHVRPIWLSACILRTRSPNEFFSFHPLLACSDGYHNSIDICILLILCDALKGKRSSGNQQAV